MTMSALLLQRFLQAEEEATGTSTHVAEPAALLLPRLSALISLLAVICVFLETGLDLHQKEEGTPTPLDSHIQVFYQIPLLFFSLAFVWGTAPVPSSLDVWGAYGNSTTCTAQGFMLQFGLFGAMAWDALLSWCYMRMAQGKGKSRLTVFHCCVWPLVLILSIYPLTQGLYNFNYNVCWINEYPQGCKDDEEVDCERGEEAELWQGFTSLSAMLHVVYSIIIMICLYRGIRQSEKSLTGSSARTEDSSQATPPNPAHDEACRAMGMQGMLYASGMVVVLLPTVVYMILFNATGIPNSGLSAFAITLTPLAGYVNFLIFIRNRRVEDCHTTYARLLKRLHCCLGETARDLEDTAPMPPEEVDHHHPDLEKQKVLSALREGQLDAADVAVIAAPPTSFLGGLWFQIRSLFADVDEESVADSDCGVFTPKNMSRRERREARRAHHQRSSPMGTEAMSPEEDSDHQMRPSERDQTSVTCDLHDSLPSSDIGPPMMPMRLASDHLAISESFAEESGMDSSALDSSFVDSAPPTRPLRYETDADTVGGETSTYYGGENSTFGGENSTYGGETSTYGGEASTFGGSTLASEFPDSVQQAILIEYANRSQSTFNSAPPDKPVRYDTDVESAVEKFLDAVERAPRQPVRYDTCSEVEESDIDTTADSIQSKNSSGIPTWALHVLRKLERSEGEAIGKTPPSKPVRYDSEVESMLESLAEESVSTMLSAMRLSGLDDETIMTMDAPDLGLEGQVVPPDWAVQYLRKVAQSESSESVQPSRTSAEPSTDEASSVGRKVTPPIFEVVASKNAPTKPKRCNSDVSDRSAFA